MLPLYPTPAFPELTFSLRPKALEMEAAFAVLPNAALAMAAELALPAPTALDTLTALALLPKAALATAQSWQRPQSWRWPARSMVGGGQAAVLSPPVAVDV